MPVAPKFPFRKVTCSSCGWSHISVQRSDVICRQCGETYLIRTIPNLFAAAIALSNEIVRDVLRRKDV